MRVLSIKLGERGTKHSLVGRAASMVLHGMCYILTRSDVFSRNWGMAWRFCSQSVQWSGDRGP